MVERGAFTRIRRVVLIAVLGVVVLLASAGVAFGLPPFTTGTKSSPPATVSQAQLVRITTGCGASYDRLVFRFGFANSRSAARQMVNHGHVQVNGRKVDISSYNVKPGDTVKLPTTPVA